MKTISSKGKLAIIILSIIGSIAIGIALFLDFTPIDSLIHVICPYSGDCEVPLFFGIISLLSFIINGLIGLLLGRKRTTLILFVVGLIALIMLVWGDWLLLIYIPLVDYYLSEVGIFTIVTLVTLAISGLSSFLSRKTIIISFFSVTTLITGLIAVSNALYVYASGKEYSDSIIFLSILAPGVIALISSGLTLIFLRSKK